MARLERRPVRFARVVDAIANCSTRDRVPPERLAGFLRGGALPQDAVPQLVALFAESPLSVLVGFADDSGVSAERLGQAYRQVKELHGGFNRELEDWLRYLEIPAPGDAAAPRWLALRSVARAVTEAYRAFATARSQNPPRDFLRWFQEVFLEGWYDYLRGCDEAAEEAAA